jgi:hypothetical protein
LPRCLLQMRQTINECLYTAGADSVSLVSADGLLPSSSLSNAWARASLPRFWWLLLLLLLLLLAELFLRCRNKRLSCLARLGAGGLGGCHSDSSAGAGM